MVNDFDETHPPAPKDREPIEDLEIDDAEASKLKGGARRRTEDPCQGGE